MRIKVPFGQQTKVGIFLGTKTESEFPIEKLKPIIEVLDGHSLFTDAIFSLCQWASEYYHHAFGDILHACLPVLLRKDNRAEEFIVEQMSSEVLNEVTLPTLNEEQANAVSTITNNVGFQTYLLEGVTGSGKTEVYLKCIEKILQQGKQALVLVPEIGLTPQTVSRFEKRFQVPIALLHSKLTSKKRMMAWLSSFHGEAKIIIGTRSAIFTPLPNLGIIIMDEEHDLSFKQQSGFRYSARDLAIMRGKIEDVPVILGSATPSLESLHNAQRERYSHIKLTKRAGNAIAPNYHIVDIRHKKLAEGLSDQMLSAIKKHTSNGNQVLIFLNRRGYAPTLVCQDCGWVAECPHCDAKMTFHNFSNKLCCHHCGTQRTKYPTCLSCKSKELITLGMGTEKLEEVLTKHFPETPVIRIDSDSTRNKNSMQKMLDQIQDGHSQILIGTQMLAKGHHFPNVTMVGIIDADFGLLSSDFRALERFGQTVLQVSGRAGREEKKGEVLIQTLCPHNPLLQQLLMEGYNPFANAILQQRRITHLPPFSFMVLIRAESKMLNRTNAFLNDAKDIANQLGCENLNIYGPIPAAMLKKGGQYRAQLLIQTNNRSELQRWLKPFVQNIEKLKSSRNIRWSIDIDPQEL